MHCDGLLEPTLTIPFYSVFLLSAKDCSILRRNLFLSSPLRWRGGLGAPEDEKAVSPSPTGRAALVPRPFVSRVLCSCCFVLRPDFESRFEEKQELAFLAPSGVWMRHNKTKPTKITAIFRPRFPPRSVGCGPEYLACCREKKLHTNKPGNLSLGNLIGT